MSWFDAARDHIRKLDETLPADMPFADRSKAVREAYPFGERRMHPYKMWLKAQKQYLLKFAPADHDGPRFPMSPLERAIARAKRLETQSAGDA